MNHISKPHIVDLLRIFDKRKFFVPRIRYASVRSKPELLKDLKYYFGTRLNDGIVYYLPNPTVPTGVPRIHYSLAERKYYFDGLEIDAPTHSRHEPGFRVIRGPITLVWNQFLSKRSCREVSISPLSTCTAAASLSASPEPEPHDHEDCST